MKSPRQQGFTLVELLVVIGIIAVLIAILLPTLGAARRQAQMAGCLANQRSLAQACMLRASDSKGYLPLAGRITVRVGGPENGMPALLNDARRTRYTYVKMGTTASAGEIMVPLPAALSAYLGYKGLNFSDWNRLDQDLNDQESAWRIFQCPATDAPSKAKLRTTDPNDKTRVGQGTMLSLHYETPVSRARLAWSTNSDFALNESVFGYIWHQSTERTRLRGNIARLRNPGQVVLFTDANPQPTPAFEFMPDGWILWTPPWSEFLGPIALGAVFDTASGLAPQAAMFDKIRHRGRINIAFADGHVETRAITKKDLSDGVWLTPP